MSRLRCLVVALFLSLVMTYAAHAQVQLGVPKFSTAGGGPVDTIDLANLNVHFAFPVLHKPGRGIPFNFDMTYDTTFWQVFTNGTTLFWNPIGTAGWSGSALNVGTLTDYITYDSQYYYICNITYIDGFGTPHLFTGCAEYDYIHGISYPLINVAADGSGYSIDGVVASSGSNIGLAYTLTTTDGSTILAQGSTPLNPNATAGSVIDRNGNEITTDTSGNYKDTLGLVALKAAGGVPNPYTLTYTDTSGNPQAVTLTFKSYTVQTNFGCSGIADYPATTGHPVDRMTLPNGTYYQFTYETTPGYPSSITGRLASITLPTGGTISYTYSGGNHGIECADGSTAGFTRTTPDGTWTYARTLGSGAASTTTITDPQNNVSVYQFQGIYETSRQVYQGAVSPSNALISKSTCYNAAASPCTGTAITSPITQRTIKSTLDTSNVQGQRTEKYNVYGMATETDDYDFGTGAPGALLKKITVGYASLGNITGFAQTQTTYNGAGTQVAQTTFNYDGGSLVATSGLPQHINVTTSRGNLTSTQRWLNTTGTEVTNYSTFYDTGEPATSKDPLNNVTTYTYSTTFGGAYLTQVSNALSQATTANYDANSGVLLSVKDANSQTTMFSYDKMLRPTQVTYPDGGQNTLCFTDEGGTGCSHTALPLEIVATQKINSTTNLTATATEDGLGRTTQTQLTSDPDGVDTTTTAFDSLGRTSTVTNPHRSTSSPTDGTTTYQYDGLGRTKKVVEADGSSATTSFSGNCTTLTDEASNATQSCVDGLGRTTKVVESPASLNYETDYTYDALGNRLGVTQKGGSTSANWRVRSFTYDSLSRLTGATNPESGTSTYTYDANGNVLTKVSPAPNQTGTATVTISYCYDALNRLTTKAYTAQSCPMTSPVATYTYDLSSIDGDSAFQNTVGRLMKAQRVLAPGIVANTWLDYDPLGRVFHQAQCARLNCGAYGSTPGWWIVTNTYDLAGDLVSYSDALTSVFTQTFDAAGRPSGISSNWVDSGHPATLLTVNPTVGYAPTGALNKATLGNGLIESFVYNNRFQPCRIASNSSGTSPATCADTNTGNVLDYSYGYNAGTSDNGNIASWKATGNQTFARTFGYDALNRIASVAQASGSAQGCGSTFTLTWGTDAWGNRTDQNLTAGGPCNTFHYAVNAKNQFTGASYDAAGNLLGDGAHGYYYDAENRIAQVDGNQGVL